MKKLLKEPLLHFLLLGAAIFVVYGSGVETGHFLFIGVVLSSIAILRRISIPFPRWTELVPPYAIGSIAMFWVIQRLNIAF